MIPAPFDDPTPCHGRSSLFDSRHVADHREARKLCATCPVIAACRTNLAAVLAAPKHLGGSPEGTWAGRHFGAWKRPGRPGKDVA